MASITESGCTSVIGCGYENIAHGEICGEFVVCDPACKADALGQIQFADEVSDLFFELLDAASEQQ